MRTVIIDGVEMTFHEAHQHLWNWLAENSGKDKEDYFESHDVSIYILHKCFACSICNGNCKLCPIVKWRKCVEGTKRASTCFEFMDSEGRMHTGIFEQWSQLMDNERFDEACEIAKEIANLEWEEVRENIK